MFSLQEDSASSRDSSTSGRRKSYNTVMFTGYDNPADKKAVVELGGKVTEDTQECAGSFAELSIFGCFSKTFPTPACSARDGQSAQDSQVHVHGSEGRPHRGTGLAIAEQGDQNLPRYCNVTVFLLVHLSSNLTFDLAVTMSIHLESLSLCRPLAAHCG